MQDPLQDTTRRDQVVMKSRRKHEGENRKREGGERGGAGLVVNLTTPCHANTEPSPSTTFARNRAISAAKRFPTFATRF